jgi:hypothetical protein
VGAKKLEHKLMQVVVLNGGKLTNGSKTHKRKMDFLLLLLLLLF